MHDCRRTQEDLLDLVFDETGAATRRSALAEVEACAACAAEYRSLATTLDLCDEATAAVAPRESYWPQYHAALARRLLDEGRDADTSAAARVPVLPAAALPLRVPVWRRMLTASVRVPAPLAACAVLLLVAASVLSLALVTAPAPEPVIVTAPASMVESAPQIRFVEVPAVKERIVTQTIYVPRRDGEETLRRPAPRANLAEGRRPDASQPAAAATAAATPARAANLSGFKPAGELNLRIIREGGKREQ